MSDPTRLEDHTDACKESDYPGCSCGFADPKIWRDRCRQLEKAIRSHRDQRGDDRCWLDDVELYKVLGEGETNLVLPSRENFLSNCARYWEQRQNPSQKGTDVGPQGRWVSRDELNQCDGCMSGLPADDKGRHVLSQSGGYRDLMYCQKDKYKK